MGSQAPQRQRGEVGVVNHAKRDGDAQAAALSAMRPRPAGGARGAVARAYFATRLSRTPSAPYTGFTWLKPSTVTAANWPCRSVATSTESVSPAAG